MVSEQQELQSRLDHLGRSVPGMSTAIIEGSRWMVDMARLQYDISMYMMRSASAQPQVN